MKKQTNKQRKLQFIRTKNSLRMGVVSFHSTTKASNILTGSDKTLLSLSLITRAKKSLFRNYKLKTRDYPKSICRQKEVIIGTDFADGTSTIVTSINLTGNLKSINKI